MQTQTTQKDLNIRYSNPQLQKKWEAAVSWLRTNSRNGWVLDKKQERYTK
jgi:hypothetical protein